MRALALALCLAAAAAPVAALRGITVDIDTVQAQLSNMMGETNDRLAKAEEHHKQVVDQARDDILEDFDSEAGMMGDAVTHFEGSLISVEQRLESAINMSKAGIAQAAKAPGAGDWQGGSFAQKAKLSAEVSSAERSLRRLRRQRPGEVKTAMSRAEEPLEDETERLGLVLGDLSKDMDAAKERIEDTVDLVEMSGNLTRNATRDLGAQPPLGAVAKTPKEEEGRLVGMEKSLKDAIDKSKAASTEAQAALDAVLNKEKKGQQNKTDSFIKQLKDAQHQEVSDVGAAADMTSKLSKSLKGSKQEAPKTSPSTAGKVPSKSPTGTKKA